MQPWSETSFKVYKLLNSVCIEPFKFWFHARRVFNSQYLWKSKLTCPFSSHFPQWKDVTEEKYVITPSIQEAAIIVTSTNEPMLKLSIHLTSPVVREQVEKEASGGMISLFRFWTKKTFSTIRRVKIKFLQYTPAALNCWMLDEWGILLSQILGAFSII